MTVTERRGEKGRWSEEVGDGGGEKGEVARIGEERGGEEGEGTVGALTRPVTWPVRGRCHTGTCREALPRHRPPR